ncbi:MAG: L-lactate permease [Betaproteobacteria bacterium]|nr:L-lactate permease [Betaproteobacteria bacterium]
MHWSQQYNPTGSVVLSTFLAAVPVILLLGGLGFFHIRAHIAAIVGMIAALLIAILVFGMPVEMAGKAALFGGAWALTVPCWIILNTMFLYKLTVKAGLFQVLQDSIGGITSDRRLQLILIAFCFGAFFEGAAGGGTPVAVTGAMLIGLGFNPLAASGLALIANTAPVAYGGSGTPILVLNSVTQNTDSYLLVLSAMVGRQLPFFSVIVPIWLVAAFAGFRGTLQVLPAVLVAGFSFAIPQFIISNYHGPWVVDMVSAMISMVSVAVFLKYWQPKQVWLSAQPGSATVPWAEAQKQRNAHGHSRDKVIAAWAPWVIVSVVLMFWAWKAWKGVIDIKGVTFIEYAIPGLHQIVERVAPVVATPHPEAAVFKFGLLSSIGTGILIAGIVSGLIMKISPREILKSYAETFSSLKFSFITIFCMLALSYTTRYSGMDATMGLAMANTGWWYPFFGTLIGWLGVALTGTDAGSNALFGSQQQITANQLGLSPELMAAANSSGGVMGKMIDAQSIVVASVATNYIGKEGVILRYVFWHSIALASLVGVLVMLQAYVPPFTKMVVVP